ncbi:PPC domain-containing DNA-binding protein [Sinorhizobium meliloti]|uniref:PPC domain-containing DNA-binding protein n=1 Tax=Rhizobium meliloti TaxID=382 RepID=UPI0013E3DA75|nr:PPC domain-containing DNA-binding protein [Sinorhizobium meliloti]
MKQKLLAQDASERTFILVLEEGDEAFSAISAFAAQADIAGASVTAIGAFSSATVGFFRIESRDYRKIPVAEQSEVLSAIGDIARDEAGRPSLHLHAVLGSTRGGHLLEGYVRPTLEVIIRESPTGLCRRKRPELGIALIELDAE